MPLENETPRISRLRTVPLPDTLAIEDSVHVHGQCVTRNGSVLKLAQNFKEITPIAVTTPSLPMISPVSLADIAVLTTPDSCQQWASGEFLNRHLDHLKVPLTGRPSVQKLRSENIGKVSAHVRKFDKLASPTLPDARCVALNSGVICSSTNATPFIHRSPRKCTSFQRQLSDPQVVKDRSTSPKTPQVSPLRESQRANALPQSCKANERYDLKVISKSCVFDFLRCVTLLFFSLDQSTFINAKPWYAWNDYTFWAEVARRRNETYSHSEETFPTQGYWSIATSIPAVYSYFKLSFCLQTRRSHAMDASDLILK